MVRYKRGYWQSEDNIKSELLNWHDKVGCENFNSDNLMKEHCALFNGIKRSKKTLVEWADALNLKHNCTPKDYYKNLKNIDKEVDRLVVKYGFFPNREVLTIEGKNSIANALRLYHNTTQTEYLRSRGIQEPKRSKLESHVFKILDTLILDKDYVNNKYKALEKYGVCTKNPETGNYLEIDRFYISQRLAIEIQGQQHYKHTKYWDAARVTSTKHRDQIKRELLKKQDVKLIEIKYNNIGIETIRSQLIEAGVKNISV